METSSAGFGYEVEGHLLAAGWHRVDCTIHSEVRLLPLLIVTYVGGEREVVPLPSPDANGRIRMLVMFRLPVSGIFLRPHSRPARFRLGTFSLCVMGRIRALASMLGRDAGSTGWAGIRSAMQFAIMAPFGLRNATRHLFDTYRNTRVPTREDGDAYVRWVEAFDTIDDDAMERMRARAEALGHSAPLISVLLPVYQTPERWLRDCIESVLAQVYPHWELCISDDASPDNSVREVVREYARRDARIRYVFREANGHISESSNSALALSSGTYIALLDHDDELRPHALLEMAEAVCRNPSLGLVYSDEDKINEEGERFHPNFKPDWNPDLLRSQNYICHLTMIRSDLAREVGGFRKGFEGSQDHDLILRCAERLKPENIHHVPKVLYHWRAIEGSTALARNAKDYAAEAGAKAVREHLNRLGSNATVDMLPHGHFRVRWPIPEPAPRVSLVIPTRDKSELLRTCVESILTKTRYPNFEVVVVDNNSTEADAVNYIEGLQGRSGVRVLRYDMPFNYSALNNWAVSQCDGTVIGLVNNDIEVISEDWLQEMVSYACQPEVGAVGAMLYYPNETIQHAGVILGIHGVAAHIYSGNAKGYPGHGARALVAQSLSAVTAACLLVRRDVFEQLGGLDTALAVAFNDIDFCLRVRDAGYRNVWTPFAELYHHESASRGHEDTDDKRARFSSEVRFMLDRWGAALSSDPAYNPNLSLSGTNGEFAFPPR